MPDCSDPSLSNPDGQKPQVARELLCPFLKTHDIHDYILEGICKAVDGVHILLVVKTGGGVRRHKMEIGMNLYTIRYLCQGLWSDGGQNINIHLTVCRVQNHCQDYLHCYCCKTQMKQIKLICYLNIHGNVLA